MKRLIFLSIWMICMFPMAKGQTGADKNIRDASKTAADAGLKKYQKFSNNDSIRWIHGGDINLNFAATHLSNWAKGGEDQIGASSVLNLYANYKHKKWTLENYGIFAYGVLKRGSTPAVKNDDKIYLTTKGGYQMAKKWYYTTALLLRTQFAPGYKYSSTDTIRVSDFIAPLDMYLSVGLDYRPTPKFSSVFSPLMGKATFANSNSMDVLSNAGLVINEGKDADGKDILAPHHSRYEFGGGILLNIAGDLFKNRITYKSQLELFSNYLEDPENIDVTWAFATKMLIYKNISADFRIDMKYDDNQKTIDEKTKEQHGAKLQTKYFLGVGLFYEF